jgi:hypothetical protein
MHATRTIDKRSPRMVKRRNSPYKSFDRAAPRRVDADCRPTIKTPGRPAKAVHGY